jgi:hypothetical protein
MVLDFSSQLAISNLFSRVVDQDPDPQNPYVFGPPGSGFINTSYGSRTGSFCRQAKIVRKPLIPTVLLILLDVLSFKIDANVRYLLKVPVISRKTVFKKLFFCQQWKFNYKNRRIRIYQSKAWIPRSGCKPSCH